MTAESVIRAWRRGAMADGGFVCELLYAIGVEPETGRRVLPADVAEVVARVAAGFPVNDADWDKFAVIDSAAGFWPPAAVQSLRGGLTRVRTKPK